MADAIHLALSGLRAFQKKSDVIAHNVANANTDKINKNRTTFSESSTGGGVSAQVDPVRTPGIPKEIVRENETVEVETSHVDLGE